MVSVVIVAGLCEAGPRSQTSATATEIACQETAGQASISGLSSFNRELAA